MLKELAARYLKSEIKKTRKPRVSLKRAEWFEIIISLIIVKAEKTKEANMILAGMGSWDKLETQVKTNYVRQAKEFRRFLADNMLKIERIGA